MMNLLKTSLVYFKKSNTFFVKKNWPFLIIIFLIILFFWKVFVLNLVPLPADILAGPNYPVKNPITTDSISFSYPMKHLVIDSLKNGQIPLWNKYILFGTPLLANFQSGVFSITNIFYFLTDFNTGWSLQIIFQHLLASFFMYFLLRYWKISKFGSVIGAISFGFGGFNLIWSEWNSHALTASFIPLIILFTDKFINKKNLFTGIILSLLIALQIFSGYPQIVLYTIPSVFLFTIVKNYRSLFIILITIVIGFLLAAPQLLPGFELLKLSQRDVESIPKEWVFLTPRQVITFIAPDFYGNHATYNYWGDKNYTSNIGFVGVVSLTTALIAIIENLKRKQKSNKIYFLSFLIIIAMVMSFENPISLFLWQKNILGLKAGASYRILVLFSFAISALSGFGFDYFKKNKSWSISLGVIFITFSVFWLYAITLQNNIAVRNLILPSSVFLFTFTISFKTKFKYLLLPFMVIELFYFGWKFTPFVPRKIIFPETEITKYLKNVNEEFRIVGAETIPVDTNMVYKIEMGSGYDAEYPASTAKYLGVLNSNDAKATGQDRYGLITNKKSKLLDLSNIKYFVNSSGLILNKSYLPRNFYVDDYLIENNTEKIFEKLLQPDFDLKRHVILEEDPLLKVDEKLYFISETYYPGWKAYVDNKETMIYKADYNFRAIKVPKGIHDIRFEYKPDSFYGGVKIAVATLVILGIIGGVHELCKKKFL